jgi:hypothetical protein
MLSVLELEAVEAAAESERMVLEVLAAAAVHGHSSGWMSQKWVRLFQ